MTQKIIDTLERDIRNQVLIDQMKKATPRDKIMLALYPLRHFNWWFGTGILFCFATWFFVVFLCTMVFAAECPDPGVKCKVLYLTEQEQQMLMTTNGILDTAAQGRALDLGQFSVYLKTRIGLAPQGEVKPLEKPEAGK